MARVISIKINRVFKTNEEINRGLMFLKKLPRDTGALFCMKETKIHRFWMKNTYVALDILFLDKEFRVTGFVENAKPLNLEHVYVEQPSKYIIEIKAGYVKKNDVRVGDYIKPLYKSQCFTKKQMKKQKQMKQKTQMKQKAQMKKNTKTRKHI